MLKSDLNTPRERNCGMGTTKTGMKPTHVAVYHRQCEVSGKTEHHYDFAFGRPSDLPGKVIPLDSEIYPGSRHLVKVSELELPEWLATELSELEADRQRKPEASYTGFGRDLHNNQLGLIRYTLDGTTAISRALYPKARYLLDIYRDKKILRNLGALLEHACVKHLKTQGVTHCSTTPAPEDPRIKSLKKMGLPINTPVPIDEWLAGLERGFPKPPEPS